MRLPGQGYGRPQGSQLRSCRGFLPSICSKIDGVEEFSAAHIGRQTRESYFPVTLDTSRGHILCHHYHLAGEKRAVLYVGGGGGGFDTPARNLYPRLCQDLLPRGVSGLRLKFRNPRSLPQSVFDVMAGIAFLREAGIEQLGLIGHSFGGAVVIQAGARSNAVRTIVTLATQSRGTDEVANLRGQPILLIHGRADEVVPPSASELVYDRAPEPRKLVVLDEARHVLDEKAEDVYHLVYSWMTKYLIGLFSNI